MKKSARYEVMKAIPIGQGKEIPVGTAIYRILGVYYMDGGLLPKSYQEDFDKLIDYEEVNGWNYISPIRTIEAFKTGDDK